VFRGVVREGGFCVLGVDRLGGGGGVGYRTRRLGVGWSSGAGGGGKVKMQAISLLEKTRGDCFAMGENCLELGEECG